MFTTDQVGKKIAVVLDGLVVVAPIVTTPLKGGRFTIPMTHPTAANELAVVLRAGPLAAPMLEETVNDLRGGKVIPNLE